MTAYPSAPIDGATQDTLDLLGVDPSKRTDREVVEAAVEEMSVGDLERTHDMLEAALESGEQL